MRFSADKYDNISYVRLLSFLNVQRQRCLKLVAAGRFVVQNTSQLSYGLTPAKDDDHTVHCGIQN